MFTNIKKYDWFLFASVQMCASCGGPLIEVLVFSANLMLRIARCYEEYDTHCNIMQRCPLTP